MNDVVVEVFFSKTCPNCPPQKKLVKKFSDREDVKIRLTDVMDEKQRAKDHSVSAVPTTVIDGPKIDQKTGFRGITPEEKIETAIAVAKGNKDPEELENPGLSDLMKNLLERIF